MRVLITGAQGQLGRMLRATPPPGALLFAHGSDTLDITDEAAVRAAVRSTRPSVILNAAAYTAVDQAESDEERAYAVNARAVGTLARAAREADARLVHISTDFVFDGRSGVPYAPDAQTNPLGAYGRTKYEGERLAGNEALIVRTSWVYAASGGNFVRTMIRLMRERSEIRVVADQVGAPTYALDLARAVWGLIGRRCAGLYHHSDAGVASWYDFAVAIKEEALAVGLIERDLQIIPITTKEYPVPATRPSYSVLDTSKTRAALGKPAAHWRSNLRIMLSEMKANG